VYQALPQKRKGRAVLQPSTILNGFRLRVIEGPTKVFYPEASNTVIFIIMAIVLLIKPAGLFGAQR